MHSPVGYYAEKKVRGKEMLDQPVMPLLSRLCQHRLKYMNSDRDIVYVAHIVKE